MPTQRKPLGPDSIVVTQVTCTPHPARPSLGGQNPQPTVQMLSLGHASGHEELLRSSVGPGQRPSLEEGEGDGERGPETQSCFSSHE